jgi:hypothetical protein
MTKWELFASGLSWLRRREILECKMIPGGKGRRWILWWSYQELPDESVFPAESVVAYQLARLEPPRPMLVDTGAEVSIFPAGTVDCGTGTGRALIPGSRVLSDELETLLSASGHPVLLRRVSVPVFLLPRPDEGVPGVPVTIVGYERVPTVADAKAAATQTHALLGLGGGAGSLSSFSAFVGLESGCAALIR